MKTLTLLILAGAALSGCAVVPVERPPVAYVAVPAPVVYVPAPRPVIVARPHHFGYARVVGGPRMRHWH